jgi:hypothetical protein
MTQWGRYAIIDDTEGSPSRGKILLLLDDERAALEIASELRTRRLDIAIEIRRSGPRGTPTASSPPRPTEATITPLRAPVAGL